MFAHISYGVRDIARTRRFYEACLAPLGLQCLHGADDALGFGRDDVGLWLTPSASPVPADPASGLHICFAAPDRASVAAFHAAAIAHGGRDNGAPGLRADYGPDYYAAFVIDPDGYRLEAWYGGPA